MENIADSVVAEGIAERVEVERLITELYELARDKRTFISHPPIVQAWGYRTREVDH
jgi:hypothetical protein